MPRLRSTLNDRRLERRFQRDGYVVLPLPDPSAVGPALEVFERIDSGISEGYYASIHSADNAYKAQVDRELSAILWPQVAPLLADFSPLVAAFMVKPATGTTVVPVHQDWITKDEADGAGITCWMPLTPITAAEGKMTVLPGSHRYLHGLRGSPGFPVPYQSIVDELRDELMVEVEVAVGEVMVMDGRVLHTTAQNHSGRMRVAAYLNALPQGSQPLHYYRAPDGAVEVFAVEPSFFSTFNIGERPDGRLVRTIDDYQVDDLTLAELKAMGRRSRRVGPLDRLRTTWSGQAAR
ncbi:phytanoyl-CoA dioxygenase family protein [Aquihabitans sp. G128]|uniref:phytanoyl-CoA dioxygenase family protein n=1 Tax=Aquihabitans sp. G128 TaxID=2849779 RepID=UPI001C23843C|nr:phytanoyl-CoA dioxygenase family protein [Aquihabitans sp. G128]QXC60301.1 phytanoyl-CoA dioxygenase family protein [Aquihabitans sp. G128]